MWDQRYSSPEFYYGTQPNDFLAAHIAAIPPGPVLDLGCGEGRNAVFLAGLGHQVTAVDFSAAGLRKGERLAREKGVEVAFVEADLATYEPELDAYAGIVAIFAHMPEAVRKHVHGWIHRALRPGGVFILEAYTPAPLAIEVGREVERDIHEGAFHGGPSATVQVVAVKDR